jgi:hypothetical protein
MALLQSIAASYVSQFQSYAMSSTGDHLKLAYQQDSSFVYRAIALDVH